MRRPGVELIATGLTSPFSSGQRSTASRPAPRTSPRDLARTLNSLADRHPPQAVRTLQRRRHQPHHRHQRFQYRCSRCPADAGRHPGGVWIAIGGIALYTLLVGADAAVVRAAIMGGLFVSSFVLRPVEKVLP